MKGKLTSTSSGSETEWIYTISPVDSTIIFERNGSILERNYSIDNDYLTLVYIDDDSARVEEGWRKQ